MIRGCRGCGKSFESKQGRGWCDDCYVLARSVGKQMGISQRWVLVRYMDPIHDITSR